jgi:hypothetical protein
MVGMARARTNRISNRSWNEDDKRANAEEKERTKNNEHHHYIKQWVLVSIVFREHCHSPKKLSWARAARTNGILGSLGKFCCLYFCCDRAVASRYSRVDVETNHEDNSQE